MQDWNQYRDSLLARVGDFAKHSPDVVRGSTTIDNAAAKTGHLEPKIHELIASLSPSRPVAMAVSRCISKRPSSTAPRSARFRKRWVLPSL